MGMPGTVGLWGGSDTTARAGDGAKWRRWVQEGRCRPGHCSAPRWDSGCLSRAAHHPTAAAGTGLCPTPIPTSLITNAAGRAGEAVMECGDKPTPPGP